MSALPLIIYIFMIILGILERKSKVIGFILLLYIWCLIGLNTYSPDYASYEAVFNGTYYGLNMDIGFNLCCSFFHSLGLTFQQFRMVWALLYILLVSNFVNKNTKNRNFVLSLLLICPVLLDVSGIRSSVAYLIALNFSMLLKKPTRRNKILFILGVILASSIHVTSIFYLIFILIDKTLTKMQTLIFVGVAAAVIYSPLFGIIATVLYKVTGIYAIQKWLLGGSANTHPNFVGIMSVALFLVLYVYIACKQEQQIRFGASKDDEFIIPVTNYLKSLAFYMLFLLPVLMISTESRRMLYGVLMVFYCITGNLFTDNDTSFIYSRTSFKYILFDLGLSLGILAMYMYSYQSHDVMAALRDNLLVMFIH